MPVAVEADSRSDEDALSRSLAKVAAGIPPCGWNGMPKRTS